MLVRRHTDIRPVFCVQDTNIKPENAFGGEEHHRGFATTGLSFRRTRGEPCLEILLSGGRDVVIYNVFIDLTAPILFFCEDNI